jgi:hypothetical protein
MLRSLSTSILILAATVVLCLLALRLVVSALFALSGIRRRGACRQVLSW